MPHLTDYIEWRGDLSFTSDPFNEIDSLIFAEIAYVEADDVFREELFSHAMTLEELYKRYLPYADHRTKRINDPVPLFAVVSSAPRFKDVSVSHFINILDPVKAIQFSAMTFRLPDDTICVSFRGTDATITGWREDFNFSYMNHAPSQILAKEYLNEIASKFEGKIRVTGHSKGGNLAVYASVFAKEEVKERILAVYSNDGPGFLKPIISSDEYKSMIPKMHHFIPEESMIGILMTNLTDPIIVESDSYGAYQHNPLYWRIMGNHFIEAEKRSSSSVLLDDTIRGWLESCTENERKTFVTHVFNAIEATGANRVSDIKKNPLRIYNALFRAILALDSPIQKQLWETVSKLAKSGSYVLSEEMKKEIAKRDFLSFFRKGISEQPSKE